MIEQGEQAPALRGRPVALCFYLKADTVGRNCSSSRSGTSV